MAHGRRCEIADGGVLVYDPDFLPCEGANTLFADLQTRIDWEHRVGPFGRPFPRRTAYLADPGVRYRYSGVTHESSPWPDFLAPLRRRVEEVAGTPFNSLLLNDYRTGQDSIGYHADDEPELGANPIVASISLGAVRRFILRHGRTGERIPIDLAHGSLLVMAGTTQHHWKHTVPKTAQPVGERINLTFRTIRS